MAYHCFNKTKPMSTGNIITTTTYNPPTLPNGSFYLLIPQLNHTTPFNDQSGTISPKTENSADSQAVDTVKFVIMDVLVPLVCALGLVGNLLSLVVLTTDKMHRTLTKMEISAHIGLIALAVSDFLFCLLVLIFTQITLPEYYEPGDPMIYYGLLSNGSITLFIIFSTWLIVVMAAERYIAVCHPLRARKVISLRRTRAVIAIVFVTCLVATIPIFLENSIEEVLCDDGTFKATLRDTSQQSKKIRRILWAVFFDFIPCIALIYFNLCLIIQIRKAKKLRGGLAPAHYTFQAAKRHSSRGPGTRELVFNKPSINGETSVSKALLKPPNSPYHYNSHNHHHHHHHHHRHNEHDNHNDNNVNNSNCQGNANTTTQNRNTMINNMGARNNFHHSSSSRSSVDSASNASHHTVPNATVTTTVPNRKLAIQRLVTNNNSNFYGGNNTRQSMVRKRPSDSALNSVTATLVAVVLLFLILVSPSELLKFSLSYTESAQKVHIVRYVTNFMQVLNFSLNFLLYCAVNNSFRQTLRGIVCCCFKKCFR